MFSLDFKFQTGRGVGLTSLRANFDVIFKANVTST